MFGVHGVLVVRIVRVGGDFVRQFTLSYVCRTMCVNVSLMSMKSVTLSLVATIHLRMGMVQFIIIYTVILMTVYLHNSFTLTS